MALLIRNHTMSLSLYDLSVPVFTQSLQALDVVLTKGEAHAAAKKIDLGVFLTARLAPDMFTFTRQVQLATDFAKGGAARIAKTLAFIGSIPKESFVGAENRDIVVPMRPEPKTFNALVYLRHGAIPNFYFHVTAAYAILRHNGVDLSKGDFLGHY